MIKVRVTLHREYEIRDDLETLADEYGIENIEQIDDMEDLDAIDELAGTITTWIEPGSITVEQKEKYMCDSCGLVMHLFQDEIGPCPGCGRDAYKPTDEDNPYTNIEL